MPLPRSLGVLVVLVALLAPGALAHDAPSPHVDATTSTSGEPELLPPSQGYTGPGNVPYLSFFEGAWLYGPSSATPLARQIPRTILGHGDWLVWEDTAAARVYAYNVRAGAGYYVGNASTIQRNPALSGTTLVWEEYRPRQPAQIWTYDLAAGNLRQLSTGPGNHRHPSIDGTLVAWEDDRNGTTDIWGYDLANGTEFPVYTSPDKDQDPVVLGHEVFFRAFRFNVWDVRAVDLDRGSMYEVTADAKIQTSPFTDGRSLWFLNQYIQLTWTLARYDPATGRVKETSVHLSDAGRVSVEGDRLLQLSRDVRSVQLVARNLTAGTTTHVSGDLAVVGDPLLLDGTVYAAIRTVNGTSLLALQVSPFAWTKPPTLAVTSPGALYPWVRPVVVQGILGTTAGWTEPVTFTYRVDDQAPVAIPPGSTWKVTLDNEGQSPGAHRVVVRASFREGPPVTAAITLQVPLPNQNVDVAKAGEAFHAARVFGALNEFVLTNPAAYLLMVAAVFLVILVGIRVWIYVRRSRAELVIEYVPQDD